MTVLWGASNRFTVDGHEICFCITLHIVFLHSLKFLMDRVKNGDFTDDYIVWEGKKFENLKISLSYKSRGMRESFSLESNPWITKRRRSLKRSKNLT